MFPATHALIEDQREGALMTTLDAAPKKKPEPSTEELAAKRIKQLITEMLAPARYGRVATKNHQPATTALMMPTALRPSL